MNLVDCKNCGNQGEILSYTGNPRRETWEKCPDCDGDGFIDLDERIEEAVRQEQEHLIRYFESRAAAKKSEDLFKNGISCGFENAAHYIQLRRDFQLRGGKS